MAAIAVQLAWPSPAPADHATGPTALAAPIAAADLPLDYPQVLARPLFTPARSATGAVGAGQTASAILSDYILVGVAHVAGRSEAVLRGPSGEVVSLRPGEALLGWRLAAVEAGGIVLQQGDIRRTVAVASPAGPKMGSQ